MAITHESAFEANIEAHLLGDGWLKLAPAAYDRKAGVFGDEVIAFVQASQPKAVAAARDPPRRGGDGAAEVPQGRRRRARPSGHDQRAAVPGQGLGRECAAVLLQAGQWPQRRADAAVCRESAWGRAAAAPLGVQPRDSLDLTLVVNGIPVATAELKNPLTHQNVEQAMAQYRTDRNPNDLIFRAGRWCTSRSTRTGWR
jgi:type I restriction enzyme R subunit